MAISKQIRNSTKNHVNLLKQKGNRHFKEETEWVKNTEIERIVRRKIIISHQRL